MSLTLPPTTKPHSQVSEAFGRFKGGRPEVEPLRVGDQEMWIWLYEHELIVAMEEHADGKLLLVPLCIGTE